MEYGTAPTVVAEHLDLVASEMCFVQYMPIALAGETPIVFPPHLQWIDPILDHVEQNLSMYMYVTAKHLFVSGTDCGNRPGWHSDGFGTDDINYIWSDRCPTEFAIQPFKLSDDCETSMEEMEAQFIPGTEVVYPSKSLLRLTPGVIHRTPMNCEPGWRTFVKISLSRHKYNLKGNAHNYMLQYNWDMVERSPTRNHPHKEVQK